MIRSLIVTTAAVGPLAAAIIWIAGGPAVPLPPVDPVDGGPREIAVAVHAWGFSPAVIRVRPGERVIFTAVTDDIKHGLAINELGVNLQLAPGRPARSPAVRVDLAEGVYAIHCSAFCGLGHPAMKARLVVGAPPPSPAARGPWLASLASLAVVAVTGAATAWRARRG